MNNYTEWGNGPEKPESVDLNHFIADVRLSAVPPGKPRDRSPLETG